MIDYRKIVFSFVLVASSFSLLGHSGIGINEKSSDNTEKKSTLQKKAANCAPSTGRQFLQYNNVRALIEVAGFAFTDRGTGQARYEVPKSDDVNNPNPSSIYAASLWMGGQTQGLVLKTAAHLFRQGDDFYPGPLTITTPAQDPNVGPRQGYGPAEILPEDCAEYDQFFQTTRTEANNHRIYSSCNGDPKCIKENFPDGYTTPRTITNFALAANGDISKMQDLILAPFHDEDGNGFYEPESGDYPGYDLDKSSECPKPRGGRVDLFGDYNMWYIFNDKGNIHNETNGEPIGMEIQAQAFAFSTSDDINNMTFYNYQLVNRSTVTLYDTYFGQYVDADIGCSEDDYAGCDVQRGFGYIYNGDNVDSDCGNEIPFTGLPPAIGVDFFEGPYQDNDGIDNPLTTDVSVAIAEKGIPYPGLGVGYGDGKIDNERMGMGKFLYFSRNAPPHGGDPVQAVNFYNYMRGVWIDGSNFEFGGLGHSGDADAIALGNIQADYVFPGDTDPLFWGTDGEAVPQDWTEQTAGNTVGDRRFVQSAGPFTLEPGALNNITVGIVSARATSGDSFESVELVRLADDKAQRLFDNCFRLIDGPDAPSVSITELDNELIITFTNGPGSNNEGEKYEEVDANIALNQAQMDSDIADGTDNDGIADGICADCYYKDDNRYRFQGYIVYQLANASVGPDELDDVSKARIITQSDVEDGVSRITNFIYNEDLQQAIPTEMVDGNDQGISHTFQVKNDAFATGNPALVNFKKYHYMVVAYAYNNFRNYVVNTTNLDGQQLPFLRGRKSATGEIRSYTGIPHKPLAGTVINSEYGESPIIVRKEGKGNGGLTVDISEQSEVDILSSNVVSELTYKKGSGPIDVKIIDPLQVPDDTFELYFAPNETLIGSQKQMLASKWNLIRLSTNDTIKSDTTIAVLNEQLIPDWGLSVKIGQPVEISSRQTTTDDRPMFISASMTFSDSSKQWLSGVSDNDLNPYLNWIRSGILDNSDAATDPCTDLNDYAGIDSDEEYENILQGTWSPYSLVARGNCWAEPVSYNARATVGQVKLQNLSSVDIVITENKDLWTRCPVFELQNESVLAQGGAEKLTPRKVSSVGKDGTPDGTFVGLTTTPSTGMGWFPGYAIDVNTGERLNMAFGEDSWLGGHNGRDMIWNPTNTVFQGAGEPVLGGKHYIYVFENAHEDRKMPAYDGGVYMEDKIQRDADIRNKIFKHCMWVGIPLLASSTQELMTSDVRIRLRVEKEYDFYSHDTSADQDVDDKTNSENDWAPLYTFGTGDFAASFNEDTVISRLDIINIVPNPYYAFSEYEETRLENRVKFVNLPEECAIKIFNTGGKLIRTFTKNSDITFFDWDLTNQALVPISSGVYIIHIEVPGYGEKILKFMAVMRQPDLDNN